MKTDFYTAQQFFIERCLRIYTVLNKKPVSLFYKVHSNLTPMSDLTLLIVRFERLVKKQVTLAYTYSEIEKRF